MTKQVEDETNWIRIEVPQENWIMLAATAWYGYQAKGRGAVLMDITEVESSAEDQHNLPLFYLAKSSEQLVAHLADCHQLNQWLKEYDPNKSLVFAIAHPASVFYVNLFTPSFGPTLSESYSQAQNEVLDVLEIPQDSIINQLPLLAKVASAFEETVERRIIIDVPSILETDIEKAIGLAFDKAEKAMLRELKTRSPQMLKEHRKIRKSFETRLYERWGKALDLLETILVIAQESGSDFNKKHRANAVKENDMIFEVLTRLHARACVIASEILALLCSGHADGALARWRTLHETVVVGMFIAQSDKTLAERYLEYEYITSQKAMTEYQKHCSKLGQEPFDASEQKRLLQEVALLKSKYGATFREEYGWAYGSQDLLNYVSKIRKNQKQYISFKDLEESVGLSHLRPYYTMACHWVHAGPKGVSISLGVKKRGSMLLAGASDDGLADPGHCTCISLFQITVALLNLKPDLDITLVFNPLHNFVEEAGEAFLNANKTTAQ